MSNTLGLVSVTDQAIPRAGAVVFWRLSGGVSLAALSAAWVDTGLPAEWLPSAASPATALQRAMSELKGPRRLVVALPNRAGWVLKRTVPVGQASDDTLDVEFTTELRVRLDENDALVLSPAGHPDEGKVRSAFARELAELSSADFSPWLARLMLRRLDAVGLRDTGGVYFVPQHAMDDFGLVMSVLQTETAHSISTIPALKSADAVAAISDALAGEVRAAAADIEAYFQEGKLQERAVAARVKKLHELEAKMGRYEALLGRKEVELTTELVALRDKLSLADFCAMTGAGSLTAVQLGLPT